MEFFYLLCAVLGIVVECSEQVNTQNIFKKVGLGVIVVGCLVEFAGHENELFQLGAAMYIMTDIYGKLARYAKLHKR